MGGEGLSRRCAVEMRIILKHRAKSCLTFKKMQPVLKHYLSYTGQTCVVDVESGAASAAG